MISLFLSCLCLTVIAAGCGPGNSDHHGTQLAMPRQEAMRNMDMLRAALANPSARLVVCPDGSFRNPWPTFFTESDLVRGQPKQYWVMPTPGIEISWIPVHGPYGEELQPRARLKTGYYFVRGYGVGDEARLAAMLLELTQVVSLPGSPAGLPTVDIRDNSRGVHFVGEAGTARESLAGIWLERVVAQESCPPHDRMPNLCSPLPSAAP